MLNISQSIALSTILLSTSYLASISLDALSKSTKSYSIILNGLLLGYSVTAFSIFTNFAIKNM